MDRERLKKYIGWEWNNLTKNTIEFEFRPYKVIKCDIKYFNNKENNYDIIRCLIIDDKIFDLNFSFN